MTTRILHEYHYRTSGLDGVVLIDGVEEEDTPYGPATGILDMDALHAVIGRMICEQPRPMTGREVRFLRDEMDLTQRQLGRLLGTNEQSVFRWETGRTIIPGPAQRLLAALYLGNLDRNIRVRDYLDHLGTIDTVGWVPGEGMTFRHVKPGSWEVAAPVAA